MRPSDLILKPSCLLGLQCWLNRTDAASYHRYLIRHAWPSQARWRWLLLLSTNILSWYLFLSWVSLWQGLQRLRILSVQSGEKICTGQLLDLLFLTLVTGAPTQDYFRYKLSDTRRAEWLNYVFSPEQLSWHRVFSCPKDSHASRLLKDKLQFESFLQEREIPSTHTLFEITPDNEDLNALFSGHESLFIKPRFANASRGCVCLKRLYETEENYSLKGYDWAGNAIEMSGKAAIEAFIRQLAKEQPLLVQQLLSNSTEMSSYCDTKDLVTVRLITGNNGREIFFVYGLLEIPISPEKGWQLYSLDLQSGHPKETADKQGKAGSSGFSSAVPEFGQLLTMLNALHSDLPELASIGWDLCHTESGWILIEGNTGWNLSIPQAVSSKALLTTRLPEAYTTVLH